MEWLFDGVGGATLLALVGFAYHKFRARRDMQPTQSTASESLDVVAEDKSVAVGHRSNVQASPVVYGSHNTINIAHHPQDARAEEAREDAPRNEEKKDKDFPLADVLSALLGLPAFLMLMVGIIWAGIHPGTVRGVLEGNTAASTIAFQYGTGIAVADYSLGNQVTGCADAGVVCLGEDSVLRKTISIPELPSGNWSRIAVFVTYTEGGDSSEVLVSTSSNDVELNYAGHRDGSTNRRLEFRMDDIKAISETQKSYWFPVDISYRDPGVRFPITVTVNEDRRHSHSATATFEIARLPRAVPPQKRATKSPLGADSKQITIAERVTAITSQFAYVKAIKPESDFEVDLGMSPIAVSVLIGQFEEEYGITIPKNESLKLRTVGEAIRYIEARVGHK
jgi:acyl carrier protein